MMDLIGSEIFNTIWDFLKNVFAKRFDAALKRRFLKNVIALVIVFILIAILVNTT